MCGRFISGADEITWQEYCEILRLPTSTAFVEQRDFSPTQDVPCIRTQEDGSSRELGWLHWGLLPRWAKTRKDSRKLFNVRSETARGKFGPYFSRKRCIIPAAGFYEWKKPDQGTRKIKHIIHDTARPLFSFAGLWSRWSGDDDALIETCTILTTAATEKVQPVHHRMPVILRPEQVDAWLDPEGDLDELQALLGGYDAESFVVEPVEEQPPRQGELFS